MRNVEKEIPTTQDKTRVLETQDAGFPVPEISYHEIELQAGTQTYHVATIDCGFGTPQVFNLIENSGAGLINDESILTQLLAIGHAKGTAVATVQEELRRRGCKHVVLNFLPVNYVNNSRKPTYGYFVTATATLEVEPN